MTWAEMTREQRSAVVMVGLLDGKSTRDIATDLGVSSRNIILGHINRHIPKDQRPKRTRTFNRPPAPPRTPKVSRAAKAKPVPCENIPPVPTEAVQGSKFEAAFRPLPGTSPVALVDLDARHCRWPVDIDGKTFFCGCSVVGGARYCAGHKVLSRRRADEAGE